MKIALVSKKSLWSDLVYERLIEKVDCSYFNDDSYKVLYEDDKAINCLNVTNPKDVNIINYLRNILSDYTCRVCLTYFA